MRILVDGYSMLHSCPGIAPGKARHSHHAREELIKLLTDYHDALGTPVTVVFDGAGAPPGTPKLASTAAVEVLFSQAGQTADQLIERAAYRLGAYGEVMVVTDDFAERDTIISVGGVINSCQSFLSQILDVTSEMKRQLQRHNRQEKSRYNQ
ncbi:MAG TPA: NYN domain-containing protein [Methylomirabilota bacterium]|nr:NYN domain-containing protein [Methylomirabilota bacterium]